MPPAFRAAGAGVFPANNIPNPTNLSPLAPTRVAGDILYLITVCRSNSPTVATPSGWTLHPDFPKRSSVAAGGTIYVFTRTATNDANDNPTISWSGVTTGTSGDSSSARILSYSGATANKDADTTVTDATATNPATLPDITTVSDNALVIGIAVKMHDTAQTATVATRTERVDEHTTSGNGHLCVVADEIQTPAGAAGTSAITPSSTTSAQWLRVTLAFQAAGAAHTATPSDSIAITDSISISLTKQFDDAMGVVDVPLTVAEIIATPIADPIALSDVTDAGILKTVSADDDLAISDGDAAGPSWEDEVTADAPDLWFDFEEAAGTGTCADKSGNGYVGTVTGATQGVAGHLGAQSAISLDGVDDRIATNYPLINDVQYTIEGIAYRDTELSADTLAGGDGASSTNVVKLNITHTTSTLYRCDVCNSSQFIDHGGSAFGSKRWVHWVATIDMVNDLIELFINGTSVGGPKVMTGNFGTPGNLKIGARGSAATDPFDGTMDEFVVYDYILSDERIAAHAGALGLPVGVQYRARGNYIAAVSGFSSMTMPGDVKQGDGLLLLIETADQSTSPSGGTETWSLVGSSSVSGVTRIYVYAARASQDNPTVPSIADSGDHQSASIFAFDNITDDDPWWEAATADSEATADTSLSAAGLTTTEDHALVVIACAGENPGSTTGLNTAASAWANSDLAFVQEITDTYTNQGNGGLITAAIGEKEVAGAVGATTATLNLAQAKAMLSVAILPKPAPVGGGTPMVREVGYNRSQDDPIGIADTPASLSAFLRAIDDIAGITDLADPNLTSGAQDHVLPLSDLLGITDSPVPALSVFLSRGDSLGVTDSSSSLAALVRTVGDSLGITDARTFDQTKLLADAIGITDSAAPVILVILPLADALSITDAPATLATLFRSNADALGITDAQSFIAAFQRTQADPLGITDQVSLTGAYVRAVADSLGLTDAQATLATLFLTRADPIAIADSATTESTGAIARTINDLLGVTDQAAFQSAYQRVQADPLAMTDSALTASVTQRVLADILDLTDAQASVLVAARTVADTLVVTDSLGQIVGFGLPLNSDLSIADLTDILTGVFEGPIILPPLIIVITSDARPEVAVTTPQKGWKTKVESDSGMNVRVLPRDEIVVS